MFQSHLCDFSLRIDEFIKTLWVADETRFHLQQVPRITLSAELRKIASGLGLYSIVKGCTRFVYVLNNLLLIFVIHVNLESAFADKINEETKTTMSTRD